MIPCYLNPSICGSSHKRNVCASLCVCETWSAADMAKEICLRWSEARDLIKHARATYIQLNLSTNEKFRHLQHTQTRGCTAIACVGSLLFLAVCVMRSELQFSNSPCRARATVPRCIRQRMYPPCSCSLELNNGWRQLHASQPWIVRALF